MARLPSVRTLYVIEIRAAEVSPTAKLVAMMLSTYMRPDGCAWPSIATLARDCGLSVTVVRRGIRELENAELIDSAQRAGRPSTYFATPDPEGDTPVAHDRGNTRSGRSPTTDTPVAHDRGPRSPTTAELGFELEIEQERARDNGDEPVGYGDPAAAELARAAAREARARLGARRAGDDG